MRGRYLQEGFRIAARVRMGAFGQQLVGAMNFALGQATVERQAELVLAQLKLCVETAGSSLDQVLKCNVYCTSAEKFAAVNAIYARYFPNNPPARIFVCVPQWFGPFDIEIDCIAAV